MGWMINCDSNSLAISEECAEELFEYSQQTYGEIWWELSEVRDSEGLITFNSDHMEHADYLSDPDIQAILLKHNSVGEVTWTCSDGDWAGDAWGHRFEIGKYTQLVGVITYVPVEK